MSKDVIDQTGDTPQAGSVDAVETAGVDERSPAGDVRPPSPDSSEPAGAPGLSAGDDVAVVDDFEDEVEADLAELREGVAETIEMIRPALQMDGGDIALVDIDEDCTVTVQLHGSCVGCPASVQTLKAGVERIMMDRHPAVNEVIAL